MVVRAFGCSVLVVVAALASCGRARKQAPPVSAPQQGGSAGLPPDAAGEGGEGNQTSSGGTAGRSTGGNAGRAGATATGGTAGSAMGGAGSHSAGRGGAASGASGAGGAGTGGAAGAGAASGTAGTAGAPVGPTPPPIEPFWRGPLPQGCERTDEAASDGQCSLTMDCAIGQVRAYCWSPEPDVGHCECETDRGIIGPFELEAYSGIGTCRTAADLCGSGRTIDLGSEEECSMVAESTDATSCKLLQRCKNALTSGNVDLRFVRERSIACLGAPDGSVECACGAWPVRLATDDVEPTGACEALIDRCDEPPRTEADGPPTCALGLQSTFEGYCHADAVCTHETGESSGVSVRYDERRDISCRGGEEPGATCRCSTGGELDGDSITFRRDAPVLSINDCNEYMDSCTLDAFELDGAPSCDVTEGDALAETCWASYSCRQAATFAGDAVTLLGLVWTSCAPEAGDWSCQCKSMARSVPLDVAATDAEGACEEARAGCPELIPPSEWANP